MQLKLECGKLLKCHLKGIALKEMDNWTEFL